MAPYEFTGTVVDIGETKSFGTNGFTKREFALQENGDSKYPNIVPFVLKKDRCSLLDSVKVGTTLKIGFYLSGHKWEDPKTNNVRYFCDHDAVKIEILDGNRVVVPEPATPEPSDYQEPDSDEEMPF